MSTVRIATRGSDLALAQAKTIASRIGTELGRSTELVVIKTTGDTIQDVSLAKIGGKGLFVKEIEEALLANRADVAVHSAKDLPGQLADGLQLAAFPERQDDRDALVSHQPGVTLATLAQGARVGTGSTRRIAQLLAHRPDLEPVALRGNVPTRIAKLESENLAAVVLACAGLDRLGLTAQLCERIDRSVLLPAACQGALALEVRSDSPLVKELAQINDTDVEIQVLAERGFLARLGGDCSVPVAARAQTHEDSDALSLRGMVLSLNGQRIAQAEATGERGDAAALGRAVADRVLADGGEEILAELRASEAQ
jgi:hydroxymethylbilane synthase